MDTVEKETQNRRAWTDEETIAFLKCYKLHEWEMSQSRKKMAGYKIILDDLIFMGVPESVITVINLQSKMSSLSRAYHRALFVETINGEGSSGFAFMNLMKDIFGSPSTSGSSISETSRGQFNLSTPSTLTSASSTLTSASSTLTSAPSTLTGASSIPVSFTNDMSISLSGQSTLRAVSTMTKAPSNLISASSFLTNTQSSNGKNLTSRDESDESKRRIWKYDETRALINCFASREEESRHPKKSKNVFKNILEDLESMKTLTAPTTESNVKQKWERLLYAYKTASDAERLTGRGSSTFMYMDDMDEIFSERPIMANSHTVNLYGENIQAVSFRPIQKEVVPVDENDEEENVFRSYLHEKEINSAKIADFEQFELSQTKYVDNTAASNAKQTVPKNVLRLSDHKNVEETSSKNVPKNPILTQRTTTIVSSLHPEKELVEVACFNFDVIGSNVCMGIENSATSIMQPAVPRALVTKNIAGTSAKNVSKNQISNRTTPTAITGGKDTRSLLMTEMGLDDKYVDGAMEPKKSRENQKSTGDKSKKLPYSFRRGKTGKEIAQEKREKWELEKLKRKSEARMEQLRYSEEKKQKRHEERCKVFANYFKKL